MSALRIFHGSSGAEAALPWARVPTAALADPNLNANAVRVLAAIIAKTHPGDRGSLATDSQLMTAAATGRSSLHRGFRALEAAGWIERRTLKHTDRVIYLLFMLKSKSRPDRGTPPVPSVAHPLSQEARAPVPESARPCPSADTPPVPDVAPSLDPKKQREPVRSSPSPRTVRNRPDSASPNPKPPTPPPPPEPPPSPDVLADLEVWARREPTGPMGRMATRILDQHKPGWREENTTTRGPLAKARPGSPSPIKTPVTRPSIATSGERVYTDGAEGNRTLNLSIANARVQNGTGKYKPEP